MSINNSCYGFVQNKIIYGSILVMNKLKLGLDISRINHIISSKMDVAVIRSIDDNLTVSQVYVIYFIYNEGKNKEIFVNVKEVLSNVIGFMHENIV